MADSEKRIIEHTASTEILNDDWLLKDSATGGTTKILTSLLRTLLGGDNFASTYDSSLTYYTGNMCIYNGILYECKAFSGTTGTFDSSKWTQLTITDYASKLLASDWRATSSYVRDDLVSYRGSIYRCASDSATVGTFVHTEWITANWDSIKIVLLRNNIAKEYDGSEIYNKGDLVFESPYYLCVCKENGVTGAFDTSKWITDGTISDALELVDEQIIENIAGEYDSEVEYSKDALCFKDGVLYIANADTTGTWDSTKWDATTIADIIANLRIDANDVVDVKVNGDSLVNSSKIAVLDSLTAQGSASGSIASFSDGSTHPMSKLEIGIEPQQDLHGYDYPWTGGAGKNKLGSSSYGGNYGKVVGDDLKTGTPQSYNITTNGTITVESVAAWSGVLFVTPPLEAGSYSVPEQNISVTSDSNPRCSIYITDSNLIVKSVVGYRQYAGYYAKTDVTVESGDRIAYGVSNSVANSSTTITNFYVAKTSDLPSGYTPYSNICPISGFTEANVTRCGKNLFDKNTFTVKKYIGYNGVIWDSDNWSISDYIEVKGNTSYTLSGVTNAGTVAYHCFYDNSKSLISTVVSTTQTFTTPLNACYVRLSMRTETPNEVQLELGSTATTYEPYNGNTYNVEFKDGSNPLTVYGGTLDVVSGELVVDRVSVTVDENSNIISGSGGLPFRVDLLTGAKASSSASALTGVKCNFLKEVTQSSSWGVDSTFSRVTADAKVVYFKVNSEITTIQQLKTFLQSNNLQFVYELATPQTYQLTPTQVNSLLGTNNVWADTGDVNEAVYTRDLNTTVNDIISRIEALENA